MQTKKEKKKKRKSKHELKEVITLVESNTDKDLNQSLQIATKYEKVKNKIVKEYENINKFKKKDILNVAYKRGEIFK